MPRKVQGRKKPMAKKYSGRKQFQHYGKTAGSYAYSAFKLAKRVASLVNVESKEFETQITASTPTYNGIVTTLSLVPQGTSASQREGDSLKMKSATIRGYCAAGAASEFIRMIVYIDKQNIINTGAAMLQLAGTGFATTSEKNDDNQYNSKILVDRVFKLIPATESALVGFHYELNFMDEPRLQHIHFQAGSIVATNNALKVLVISNTLAASVGSFQMNCNLRYYDN